MTKIGYQPFGENATLASNGYYYTARRFDPESSLYYYRSRMYCPAWGRFCQPDTIGYVGGINLYAYIGNDPLNLVDPLGLAAGNLMSYYLQGSALQAQNEAAIGQYGLQVVQQHPITTAATIAGGIGLGACIVIGPCGLGALIGGEAAAASGEISTGAAEINAARTAVTSAAGGGAPTGVTATINGVPLNLGADPLAGVSQSVGIIPRAAVAGSEPLDASTFAPVGGAPIPNAATAAATAAAGLIDLYQNPGENGAAPNLNQNFGKSTPK